MYFFSDCSDASGSAYFTGFSGSGVLNNGSDTLVVYMAIDSENGSSGAYNIETFYEPL